MYVQNVHHLHEHMHLNDYATAQSLPRWWSGPAASTPSADVLTTHLHHGSTNGRPCPEGYRRCCSPPDSNPVNWVPTSLGMNSGISIFTQNFSEMFILVGEWYDFIDVNITSPGKRWGDTNVVNLPLWAVFNSKLCTKNHEDLCTFVKVIMKKWVAHFLFGHNVHTMKSRPPVV